MEQLVAAKASFEAGHQLFETIPDRPRCGRVHGHHWFVLVRKLGPENGLSHDLDVLVSEWANRHLNDMLPGVNPTPEQLSLVVMERLLLAHPKITDVEVDDGQIIGIARNTPR